MLNPRSIEFWDIINPRFNCVCKLSKHGEFHAIIGIPIKGDENWMLPRYGMWYNLYPLNIYHPGRWEDSLYLRPELATEETPKDTEVIYRSYYDDNIQCETLKYALMDNYAYDLNKSCKHIIATPEMKLQYLGKF